ncbi:ATP-binding protein [Leptothoe sp. LEGE 181152]|nr:ATP-binding protein [Leptothoe sp. LEGE 181152]
MTINQELVLNALREVNFDWTMHIKSVWRHPKYDIDNLNEKPRQKITNDLNRLKNSEDTNSPLGRVVVGIGGSGKTHLLNAVRNYAFSNDIGFVLVDMTDVRDFWETVLQGYISSLQETDANGIPQYQKLIEHLINSTGSPISPKKLAGLRAPALGKAMKLILAALVKQERQKTIKFQDVVRALLLLNSDDFDDQNLGYNWLQGFGVEVEDKAKFSFSRSSVDSVSIVEGLSWLMGLRGPSVLALDQLDPVVAQYHLVADIETNALSEEQQAAKSIAKSIIEGIGSGLSSLRDKTAKTLILVSCIRETWQILGQQAISTVQDRYHKPIVLGPVLQSNLAKEMVKVRLQEAYNKVGFSPPYETYPFSPEFFQAAASHFPRGILKSCEKHREQCLSQNQVLELQSFNQDIVVFQTSLTTDTEAQFKQLDRDFEAAKAQIILEDALTPKNEDKLLGVWLQTVCYCLIKENPTIDSVDAILEKAFSGGANYPLLHGRVRLAFRSEKDREKHLCLRALQQEHPRAYQSRLKAAMTSSGIDKRALTFRRLMILRTRDIPSGKVTQKLTKDFREAGGLFGYPSREELSILCALHKLNTDQKTGFTQWLKERRPISQLSFIKEIVTWLFKDAVESENSSEPHKKVDSSSLNQEISVEKNAGKKDIRRSSSSSLGDLPIGTRFVGHQLREAISIPTENLTKHTVILAGSGSGKTVLVKRIVEEVALLGIPAIIIDGANDLAQMGDRWNSSSASWREGDIQKAEQYHHTTEVIIWTPGRESANPINLNPLPDFSGVLSNRDEYNQALDMARESLRDIVAPGKSQTSQVKQGILTEALDYFAQNGGETLEEFAELLADAPSEAMGSYSNAQKRMQEMADLLNAQISTNPLLRQQGSTLDPTVLFGTNGTSDKTRISVINFIGLPGQEQQQQFLNQLAMTLFTWIKKNPAPPNLPLRGLLVIDESKDFVPSRGSTPCKASINRLVAQARKYGLGLIFATQAPKSIDHNIIANCSTQFYGRANSPAAINVIQDQLSQRGGRGQDIAKLPRGQFYAISESLASPVKIQSPLCLSYHPATPPDEEEVLKRAKASRDITQKAF